MHFAPPPYSWCFGRESFFSSQLAASSFSVAQQGSHCGKGGSTSSHMQVADDMEEPIHRLTWQEELACRQLPSCRDDEKLGVNQGEGKDGKQLHTLMQCRLCRKQIKNAMHCKVPATGSCQEYRPCGFGRCEEPHWCHNGKITTCHNHEAVYSPSNPVGKFPCFQE